MLCEIISPVVKANRAELIVVPLLLGLALALTGCASQQQAPSGAGETRVGQTGSFPNWSVRETVEHADAVVIGTLEENLGSKGIPGKQTYYVTLFTDYKVVVEQVLYLRDGSAPTHLALLTRMGIVPTTVGSRVGEIDGFPTFQTGERVLLFLAKVSLEGEHSVPQGFTSGEYYIPLVSVWYGKLLPQGSKWKDSRSGKTVTLSEIQKSIDTLKRAP